MAEILTHDDSVKNITSLLETVLVSLGVDKKSLKVEIDDGDAGTIYNIVPAEDDVSLIIGRRGRNIKAIRKLVRAAAAFANDGRVEVKVVS